MKTARIVLSVLLGLFIFSLTLMEINPIDTSLVDRIKSLEARIDATQKARQPYLGDWYEFNSSQFSYVSDNVLQIDTSIVITDIFQIGDKVRITQSGGYKYFYVIKINSTSNQLTINGGSDYTFTSSSFTTFGVSKVTTPVGFPSTFNFNANITSGGGTGFSFSSPEIGYTMIGNTIITYYSFSYTSSTRPLQINLDLPFLTSPILKLRSAFGSVNSTTTPTYILAGDDAILVDVSGYSLTGGNFSLTFVYDYTPTN